MNSLLFNNSLFHCIDGIWTTKETSEISYPQNSNNLYFEIEDQSFWFKHRNNIILNTLKKFNCETDILDIGGGNGFVSKCLQDNGYNVYLVEPGFSGALNAKKRNIKNIICAKFDSSYFNDNSLPSVGLFDVLEHIKNDEQLLNDLHQKMAVNSLLIITIPCYKWLWSYEDEYTGHYRRYSKKEIINKLIKSGFNIKYYSHFFTFLPFGIFTFRSLPHLLFKNKKMPEKNSYKKNHTIKHNFFNAAIDKIWKYETNKIAKGQKIKFGSSIIVVAQKI